MSSRSRLRNGIAAVLVGVLVGGGLMAITPAGAEVSQMATNWTKIWKQKLQPQADKRYYKKSKSDAKYATKTETSSAFANYYNKAESDARYQPKGSYATAGSSYTKAESDGRYARSAALIRGNILLAYNATAAGQQGSSDISFGATFSAAPTVHVIPVGGAVPAGCAGSAAAPDASPGHVCIFTSLTSNNPGLSVCKPSTAQCNGTADPWGAVVFTSATATGLVNSFATWAARPVAVVTTSARQAPGGAVLPRAPGSGTQ
jgi:hypothetical protein